MEGYVKIFLYSLIMIFRTYFVDHLKDFLKLRKASLSEAQIIYLEEVIKGHVGFSNDPIFENLVPIHTVNQSRARVEVRETVDRNQENEIENRNDMPMQELGNRNEDRDGNDENQNDEKEELAAEEVNIKEQVVQKIAGYRTVRGKAGDYYLFRVDWKDGDTTEERLEMFIDEKDGEEPVVNAEFLDFELHHSRINFRDIPPPVKKRQKKLEETGTD